MRLSVEFDQAVLADCAVSVSSTPLAFEQALGHVLLDFSYLVLLVMNFLLRYMIEITSALLGQTVRELVAVQHADVTLLGAGSVGLAVRAIFNDAIEHFLIRLGLHSDQFVTDASFAQHSIYLDAS